MYETVGIREELDSGVRELLRLSRNIDMPQDATLISEQCVEVAALALRLRGEMMRPKRRRVQHDYIPA